MNFPEILFGAFVASALAFGPAAQADLVVYDNLAGGAGGVDGAFESDFDADVIVADDFLLTSTTTVTGIEWSGTYAGNSAPTADDFRVLFYLGFTGDLFPRNLPFEILHIGNAVNRTDSGVDLGANDIYEYSADINIPLIGGVKYWVSIANLTSGNSDDDFFWAGRLNNGDSFSSSFSPFSGWNFDGHQTDFRLTSVPEPGSIFLLVVTPLAMLMRRPRK